MRLQRYVLAPGMSAAEREQTERPYRERLEFELDVIVQMKFPGYFLIVADFIKWAKAQGIPVGPGRGSGAGSVVAWSLEITDLDPLRFGLLFERFLNPERVSMPDFDIDFCQDRRDEVIRYVQQRYGGDRVAHIITFGRLQARAVLRDVGRVLGLPFGQVDRICKLVPQNPANPVNLAQALEMEPQLKEERFKDRGHRPDVRHRPAARGSAAQRLDPCGRRGDRRPAARRAGAALQGPAQRHAGDAVQHEGRREGGAGEVRLPRPVDADHAADGRAAGAPGRARRIALDTLPLDDKPTYELMARAETAGVFQLEGSGMRDALRKLKPDCFDDIVAMVSLVPAGADGQHPPLQQRQARR